MSNNLALVPPAHILIVEDDPAIREVLFFTLSNEGYQVTTASDGAEALVFLRSHRPNLIMLDMCMPVMDGWTFTSRYREIDGPHSPILAMTASPDAQGRAAAIHADGCLEKPFTIDQLLSVVLPLCA